MNATPDPVQLTPTFGTFSIPIAQRISGDLVAFDIDPHMIARTRERATALAVQNVALREYDVMENGFGLADGSVDAVLLFRYPAL